jgi:hypothetical protein
MEAIIKLVEVVELSRGVSNAILNVSLKSSDIKFNVSSTGMSLRLISEVSIFDLHQISEWLKKESNDSKLRILAKKFIKMTLELKNETTI